MAKLKLTHKDGKWQVLLDGNDIADEVTGIVLKANGANRHRPEVTLTLSPGADIEIDDIAAVAVAGELEGEQDD